MIPANPTMLSQNTKAGALRQQKTVQKAIRSLSYGQPTGATDSTGCFKSFTQDNVFNQLFRIGANGATDTEYAWNASGVVTINHNLGHQPIGFKVLDKDKSCDVYRTGGAPTSTQITLTCTDNTANVTVEIF